MAEVLDGDGIKTQVINAGMGDLSFFSMRKKQTAAGEEDKQ